MNDICRRPSLASDVVHPSQGTACSSPVAEELLERYSPAMCLDEMYQKLAREAIVAGIPCDDSPTSPLVDFIMQRVKYRPGTLFFIVLGVACEMADMKAQTEGFANACDRAAKLAFTHLEELHDKKAPMRARINE